MKKLVLLLAVMSLFLRSFSVNGADDELVSESKINMQLNKIYKNDIKELEEFISEVGDEFLAGQVNSDKEFFPSYFKTELAVRQFSDNTMNKADYMEKKNLIAKVKDTSEWLIPVYDRNDQLVSIAIVKKGISVNQAKNKKAEKKFYDSQEEKDYYEWIEKKAGVWMIDDFLLYPPHEYLQKYEVIFNRNKTVDLLKENRISKIKDIFYINMKSMYFEGIYIETNNDQMIYVLDAKNQEFAQQGDFITIKDINAEVDRLVASNADSQNIGGYSNSNKTEANSFLVLIGLILIAMSAFVLYKLIRKKIVQIYNK